LTTGCRAKKKWLPLKIKLQFDNSVLVIDNMRRLLPYFLSKGLAQKVTGRAPTVLLATALPPRFAFAKGRYIVAHLFGTSVRRSLPHIRWIRLLQEVARTFPEYPILLTGAEPDREAAEAIASAVPGAGALIGLPILEVAGVIDNAALYIGVDTGITHLAGVLQQKSVVISHFGDPAWIPTYNPNARVLANSKHCVCRQGGECFTEEGGIWYRRCMYDISDGFVLASVALGLSSSRRSIPNYAGFIDEHA
jgi:ADP-heptose:LPS heptosyltransferase